MQKIALSCLMLFLVNVGSNATAQMTVMIPAYEMTCVPKNPVTGPDGIAHQYAPYQVAWDGQNRMIIKLAGADGMGNAVSVKRVSEKIALMQSGGGTHAYAVRLDFQGGSAAYNYGRVDKCTVAEAAPTTPSTTADSRIYNYSCRVCMFPTTITNDGSDGCEEVEGKTYPLRVDENKNILEWRGKTYSVSVASEDPDACAKYGWHAKGHGTSFKFCTATKGYGAIEDKDGGTRVRCNLKR